MGSSVLYAHITRTIKIGQYELQPQELAEAAYMLSKVPEDAEGGYGVFRIAEQHIKDHLDRFEFK